MLFDDGVRDRQSEAGAFILGRKERRKDALMIVRRNARAIIIDDECDGGIVGVASWLHAQGHVGAGGLDGVTDQIEQHLPDLMPITEQGCQFTVRLHGQGNGPQGVIGARQFDH